MKAIAKSKINLFLHVGRKRIDGYHEIETIFLPLERPCDTITLTDSKDGKLAVTCSIPSLSGPGNLCHRAAEAFAKFAKIRPAWKIHVIKRIPVAAGLGGGSSDAAAVLRILQKKYSNKISEADISHMASKLGADVPFFLKPVLSIATGIGENLKPLDTKCEIPIVIVFPNFPVSAKWAYQNRLDAPEASSSWNNRMANMRTIDSKDMISAIRENDLMRISSLIRNDLAPALWKKFPLLSILRAEMFKAGALAVEVSGSGSSLFAVAKSAKAAELIAKEMNKRFGLGIECFSV